MSYDVLSGVGATPPVPVIDKLDSVFLKGFMAAVSAGGSMTYNIEATGATANSAGSDATQWPWVPMANFNGLTASIDGTLTGQCTAIRARITVYGSGTLTFMVVGGTAK